MSRPTYPIETPARRAWLEQLERAPATHRNGRRVGCDCMRLGWTQWLKGDVDGRVYGETLTDAGRAMLEQWRQRPPTPSTDPFFTPFR